MNSRPADHGRRELIVHQQCYCIPSQTFANVHFGQPLRVKTIVEAQVWLQSPLKELKSMLVITSQVCTSKTDSMPRVCDRTDVAD